MSIRIQILQTRSFQSPCYTKHHERKVEEETYAKIKAEKAKDAS